MRLGTKVLLLTLAVTLGLSGVVIWVVSADITSHEIERAHATIQQAVTGYNDRIDTLHTQTDRYVRLLMEDPQYRALLDQVEFADDTSRQLALAQMKEEIFGRIVQNELQVPDSDIAPAFHVMLNEFGELRLATAAGSANLTEKLAADLVDWSFEAVVQGQDLVRQYVWADEKLYVSFGVPLRMAMGEPPTHAYFIGFRVDDQWIEHLLRLGRDEGVATVTAWYLVDGQPVAHAPKETKADRAQSLRGGLIEAVRTDSTDSGPRPIEFKAAGERFVGETVSFRPAKGSVGTFVVVSSLDEALARLRQIQRNIALITAAMVLLAILACRKLARIIAEPIEELVSGTKRIAQGNFSVPIHWSRRDELGQLAQSFNTMAAGLEQRDLIKDTFGKFVDPKIVEGFLADPSQLRLGGERRIQTVLFSDLADFTALGERLSPEELVGLLNAYLGHAADAVTESRGIVDKFIGDAVVAFWGPPLADKHAELACRAALRMVEQTNRFADQCKTMGCPPLRVRIGISTGEVLIGNIGSRNKFNYTVIGDTVNLAARLEGVNKVYNTQILVTSCTARDAGDSIVTRKIDAVRVMGRAKPVDLYEVLASIEESNNHTDRLREGYRQALTLYESRDWPAAKVRFEALWRDCDADGPSRVMARRCATLLEDDRTADWDGSWNLETK